MAIRAARIFGLAAFIFAAGWLLAGCGRPDDGAGWLYKPVQHCQAGKC